MADTGNPYFAHLACLETFVDYPGNTVVQDLMARRPDIFQFLLRVIASQGLNPARFTPPPVWFSRQPAADMAAAMLTGDFKADEAIDMPRFRAALAQVENTWSTWRGWECRDDTELMRRIDTSESAAMDAYMLARYISLFCPLQLEGVAKALPAAIADPLTGAVVAKQASAAWMQYRVTWSEAHEQAWEAQNRDALTPEYLYHGSPLSNWPSILRNGLKVTSKTKWMTTGAVYGDGIYCSDSLPLSWSYSHGGYGPVVVGVYEVWNAAKYLKTTHYYVVPQEQQLLLRYLIYMPDSANTDVATLDTSLRDEWRRKGEAKANQTRKKNSKVEARLRKEVDALRAAGYEVPNWDATRVQARRDGRLVDIAIPHQFPFSAPTLSYSSAGLSSVTPDKWTPRSTLLEAVRPIC